MHNGKGQREHESCNGDYLEHEKERQEIAFRGFQKVRQLYSYEAQVKKMMQLAGVES